MTIEIFVMALVILYMSVCFGFLLKLKYYKVEHKDIFLIILGPLFIMALAIRASWLYISEKNKEHKMSMLRKVLFMINLMKINIQFFPVFLGLSAYLLKELQRNSLLNNEHAKFRQGKRQFTNKSYELYDDLGNCVAV